MKKALMNHPTIAYAEEWKRTNPDLKVYVPEGENTFDAVNKNWIVWTQPHVMPNGAVIAPYSRWSSPKCPCPGGSESFFFHFKNIFTESDPEKFRTVNLPESAPRAAVVRVHQARLIVLRKADHHRAVGQAPVLCNANRSLSDLLRACCG